MTQLLDRAPASRAAPRPARSRRSRGFSSVSPREKLLRYALLGFVLLITIGPFLWQLSTSLKGPGEDIYTATPRWLPADPTLGNYLRVADAIPIWSYAVNSLIVAFLTVTGNAIGATLAGFALAKLRFRGGRLVLGLVLATLVLPSEVTIISQYVTVRSMGLADTLLGVALPGAISMLNVLLMRAAFQAIPGELDEAAIVDGATVWQRLIHIGLPNVRGMLSVITIFAFIGAWDDFLWPLIVLHDPEHYTLTVGLQYLNSSFSSNPRLVAAGTMIAFVPIVIVFGVLQRFFFRGTSFEVSHAGAGGESTSFNTKAYTLQTSTDGSTWSTPVTVTANTASATTPPGQRLRPVRPADRHHAHPGQRPRDPDLRAQGVRQRWHHTAAGRLHRHQRQRRGDPGSVHGGVGDHHLRLLRERVCHLDGRGAHQAHLPG